MVALLSLLFWGFFWVFFEFGWGFFGLGLVLSGFFFFLTSRQ